MGKKISLILGSGGARGLAHIGVIRRLEELGFEVVSLSGCSMGALVGGFYVAGRLEVYEKWVRDLDPFDIVKLLDLQGEGGMVSGKRLMQKLGTLLGDVKIEDLPIKYTAVAADIENEKEVWINSGSLLEAIRASISIPIFFAPVEKEGKKLVDGGVLNPVPIAPTFGDGSDLSVAVNLGGAMAHKELLPKPTKKEKSFVDHVHEAIAKFSLKSSFLQNGIFSVANSSFDAMQANLSRIKLAAYPPDILIEIPRDLCGTFEFYRANEIIDFGYETTRKVLG